MLSDNIELFRLITVKNRRYIALFLLVLYGAFFPVNGQMCLIPPCDQGDTTTVKAESTTTPVVTSSSDPVTTLTQNRTAESVPTGVSLTGSPSITDNVSETMTQSITVNVDETSSIPSWLSALLEAAGAVLGSVLSAVSIWFRKYLKAKASQVLDYIARKQVLYPLVGARLETSDSEVRGEIVNGVVHWSPSGDSVA
jgi:hypothetical protein